MASFVQNAVCCTPGDDERTSQAECFTQAAGSLTGTAKLWKAYNTVIGSASETAVLSETDLDRGRWFSGWRYFACGSYWQKGSEASGFPVAAKAGAREPPHSVR
jgi:hypothetical protein